MIFLLISCNNTEQETIKIGAIVPLSDWGAYWGIPFIKGAEIAKEEINSNNKIKFEIITEDSKGNGKDAVTAVQKLINIDKVKAIVVEFAPPTLAVSPILKEAKIPFIYDAYIKSPLKDNKYAFKSFLDVKIGCKDLIKHAKESYKNLGLILAKMEYSEICLDAVKEIEPAVNVYWYTFGDTDFRTLLIKAKSDKIDTILILGWANEFTAFFQQKTELGYKFNILCGSGSECLNDDVINLIPKEELEGTIAFDYTALTDTSFAREYKEKYPDTTTPNIIAAVHGYESIILFSEAVKNCNEITSECIQENLNNVREYPSALKSNGFKDRVLQIETELYEFKNAKLTEIKQP